MPHTYTSYYPKRLTGFAVQPELDALTNDNLRFIEFNKNCAYIGRLMTYLTCTGQGGIVGVDGFITHFEVLQVPTTLNVDHPVYALVDIAVKTSFDDIYIILQNLKVRVHSVTTTEMGNLKPGTFMLYDLNHEETIMTELNCQITELDTYASTKVVDLFKPKK